MKTTVAYNFVLCENNIISVAHTVPFPWHLKSYICIFIYHFFLVNAGNHKKPLPAYFPGGHFLLRKNRGARSVGLPICILFPRSRHMPANTERANYFHARLDSAVPIHQKVIRVGRRTALWYRMAM